jgi:hypothetical protein
MVEWKLAGETEVPGENLPQRHFVQQKIPHDQTRAWTPDRSGGKPATNRLSYGAAFLWRKLNFRCYFDGLQAQNCWMLHVTGILNFEIYMQYLSIFSKLSWSGWLRAARHGVWFPAGADIFAFPTVSIPALLPLPSGYRGFFTENKEARAWS